MPSLCLPVKITCKPEKMLYDIFVKANQDYSKYSMLQEMPEETIDDRKKTKVELNKK